VAAVVALNLVLNSVGGCVVLVVVSVSKCYTTAHVAEEKNRKKRSTERGCQTLATLLHLPCEQARQGALDGFTAVGNTVKTA
jgi:glutathione peroxidase-family protein